LSILKPRPGGECAVRPGAARSKMVIVTDSRAQVRDEKDGDVGRVGYEINFNRYFYKHIPLRPLEEIEADIEKVEKEIAEKMKGDTVRRERCPVERKPLKEARLTRITVERAVIRALQEVNSSLYDPSSGRLLASKRKRTGLIADAMRAAGERLGLLVLPSGRPPRKGCDDNSGWLFDQAWIVRTGETWDAFKRLVMACEVEWNDNFSVRLRDFHKLAVCDADLRVFVTLQGRENGDKLLADFKHAARNSKRKRFLTLFLADSARAPSKLDCWDIT